MKKFTKVTLIAAAVLAGVGILFCMAASLMGGEDAGLALAENGELRYGNWHIGRHGIYYNGPSGAEYERGKQDASALSYTYPVEGIENLELEAGAASIVFAEGSDSSRIVVSLYDCREKYYEGRMDGNTLKLAYGRKQRHLADNNRASILVEIPAGMTFDEMNLDIGAAYAEFAMEDVTCRELSMYVGAADVTVNEFHVTDCMELRIGTGVVEIGGGTYRDIDLECGVGEIIMKGSVDGNMDVECGVGSMILDFAGNPDDYNYNLSCAMGDLEVNGTSYASIAGKKQVVNAGAACRADVECGMGSVILNIR